MNNLPSYLRHALLHIRPEAEELLKRHAIHTRSSALDALILINSLSGDSMTLFAVDDDGRIAGTVTDGDIRRALIAGRDLSDPVEVVMHRNFMAAAPSDNIFMKVDESRHRDLDLLPLVKNGFITDIIDLRKQKSAIPVDAVLMAGGKGERLRPLTLDTPKPLLEVGGKPIIDYNVDELAACGVKNFFITVNYLKEKIVTHFSKPRPGITVTCVEEPCRLGTMGSLALAGPFSRDNILVMNSDLLTDLDFEAMYLRHIESDAALTMAAVPYTVSVPFAILDTEGTRVKGLTEKPTYNYFANAGVYMMRSRLVERIPKEEYLDAPDFIESLIEAGEKVELFPVNATWIDIGSPDDFRYANELMKKRKGINTIG